MNTSGIYAIVHRATRDMYVGSAINIARRWRRHKNELNNNKHYCYHLQNSYLKNGSSAFDWEIIEFVDSKSALIQREQFWVDFFKPIYNKRLVVNSPLGTKHSEETRAKMSAAAKGRVFSAEHKANISKAKKGVCTTSDNQRRILSELAKTKVFSDEGRAKISASLLGNKRAAAKSLKGQTL